jgi:hypothetical protein
MYIAEIARDLLNSHAVPIAVWLHAPHENPDRELFLSHTFGHVIADVSAGHRLEVSIHSPARAGLNSRNATPSKQE